MLRLRPVFVSAGSQYLTAKMSPGRTSSMLKMRTKPLPFTIASWYVLTRARPGRDARIGQKDVHLFVQNWSMDSEIRCQQNKATTDVKWGLRTWHWTKMGPVGMARRHGSQPNSPNIGRNLLRIDKHPPSLVEFATDLAKFVEKWSESASAQVAGNWSKAKDNFARFDKLGRAIIKFGRNRPIWSKTHQTWPNSPKIGRCRSRHHSRSLGTPPYRLAAPTRRH